MQTPRLRPCQGCATARGRARPVYTRAVREQDDYYALLGLPRNATEAEIKASYRSLQMRFHPDKTGDQSNEMSALLNRAYDTLLDRAKRLQYDGLRRGMATGLNLDGRDGLVGPIKQRAIPVADVEIRVRSFDAAVDWLQQWGSTFTFGCELPFPTPLQCDPIPRGVRIAFITVSSGTVASLGELLLEVDEASMSEVGVARVAVTRVAPNPERPLLGEGTVLKTLQNALRTKIHRREGLQFDGLFAALGASALGILPLFNIGNQDTTYDAYQIAKRCDLGDVNRSQAH